MRAANRILHAAYRPEMRVVSRRRPILRADHPKPTRRPFEGPSLQDACAPRSSSRYQEVLGCSTGQWCLRIRGKFDGGHRQLALERTRSTKLLGYHAPAWAWTPDKIATSRVVASPGRTVVVQSVSISREPTGHGRHRPCLNRLYGGYSSTVSLTVAKRCAMVQGQLQKNLSTHPLRNSLRLDEVRWVRPSSPAVCQQLDAHGAGLGGPGGREYD